MHPAEHPANGYSLSQHLPRGLVQQPDCGVQARAEGTLTVLAEAHTGDGACRKGSETQCRLGPGGDPWRGY